MKLVWGVCAAALVGFRMSAANAASLEARGVCARQAEHVFNVTVPDKYYAAYVNHLNEQAEKCFVAIFTTQCGMTNR
jgi:hypothetical protein